MADIIIRARQGEPIDSLIWRALGDTAGIEAVLEANPGLAAIADALPDGTPVILPTIARAAAAAPLVQLWD